MQDRIEERARELDEIRRSKALRRSDIDEDRYAEPFDVEKAVITSDAVIDQLFADILTPAKDDSATMPWPKTHPTFRYRPGEVTLYAGSNGGGKSLVTGQIALGLIAQGKRVCIASFEMKPKRTLYRMLRQYARENIEAPAFLTKTVPEHLEALEVFTKDKLWFYDQQGTVTSRQVIAMARFCAVELKITHIFIDSLMKCVPGEDDYNAQKSFIDALTAVARDHNVHIHLVHHIRKLSSEEVTPNKNDVKGTGAIADQVDNVLLIWRNKKKEHDRQIGAAVDPLSADMRIMCEKQRNGETEEWYNLFYHRESQQFVETWDARPMEFL